MKIALCSTFVPFIYGGARNIVEWLQSMLMEHGHKVERIYLPEVDVPDLLLQQMMAYRWIDLEMADRVICFRPQSHLIPHPHKILWFIHHIRIFYDLWNSPYRGFPDYAKHRGIRDALHKADHAAMKEAKAIFTNSKVVSDRLKKYNDIESEVLFPPVYKPDRFHCSNFNDELVYISRLEQHKRQHLLVDAMQHTKTPVRLRLSGVSANQDYTRKLFLRIKELRLSERIVLENRWISEEEKIEILANCLAAVYLPLDEDSYGYPSIEASHSSKPILTTADSGGVLDLVRNGVNGYVSEANPRAIGDAIDRLYLDRAKTAAMGRNAKERLSELGISWLNVIRKLTA